MSMQRLAGVTVLFALLGCGSSEPQGQSFKFAYIAKDGNPLFETGKDGAQVKARELTAQGPDTVTIISYADPNQPPSLIDDALAQGVQGIAISVRDAAAMAPAINKAVDAGVPVVTFDSDAPDSKRFTYYSLDNAAAGRVAGDIMGKALSGAGQVAVLRDATTSVNVTARIDGFQEVLSQRYPGVSIATTVVCTGTDVSEPTGCSAKLEQALIDYPNITAWYFAAVWRRIGLSDWSGTKDNIFPSWRPPNPNASPLPAPRFVTVGFDALADTVPVVRNGWVLAIMSQKYWGWGYQTMQILYDKVKNKKDFPAIYDSGFDVVCKSNIESLDAFWQANDFSLPLPPCSLVQ